MEIRRAEPKDLQDMVRVYDYARKFMKENGNPNQWGDFWPPFEVVEGYTKENGYVVAVGGKIVAAFGLIENAEEINYKSIDGKWLNNEPYAVIHTLGSDGTVKGVASAVFEFALNRCGNVRIDTHENNSVMRHVLEKNGWTFCGEIMITEENFDGERARLAYQKCIAKQ